MVNLPSRSGRRKAGLVEGTPTSIPREGRAGPAYLPSIGLEPKRPALGCDNWLEHLVHDDAPPSAMKLWRWLDGHGRYRTNGQVHRYAYGSWRTIAAEVQEMCAPGVRVTEQNLRTYALPWLISHGWVIEERVRVRGRLRTLWWCAWLLPFDPRGQLLDTGNGVPVARTTRRPRLAEIGAECADFEQTAAPESAPTGPYGPEDREETTTDGVVVVEAAPDRGEEKIQETPPAPPLDPKLAELLDREIDAPGRAALAAKAAEWCHRHPIERVVRAILATVKADRQGTLRTTFVAYVQGTLKIMEREGDAQVKAAPARRGPSPEEARAVDVAKAEARRAGARALADARERGARWDALAGPERAEIEAAWDLANPLPDGQHRGLWAAMRRDGCAAMLAARDPAGGA